MSGRLSQRKPRLVPPPPGRRKLVSSSVARDANVPCPGTPSGGEHPRIDPRREGRPLTSDHDNPHLLRQVVTDMSQSRPGSERLSVSLLRTVQRDRRDLAVHLVAQTDLLERDLSALPPNATSAIARSPTFRFRLARAYRLSRMRFIGPDGNGCGTWGTSGCGRAFRGGVSAWTCPGWRHHARAESHRTRSGCGG